MKQPTVYSYKWFDDSTLWCAPDLGLFQFKHEADIAGELRRRGYRGYERITPESTETVSLMATA